MQSRRVLLATGLIAPLALPSVARAQSDAGAIEDAMIQWMNDNKDEGYFDPPESESPQRGTLILKPDDERVRRAAILMAQVPKDRSPLAAAHWMIDNIGADDLMEWPPDSDRKKPANPLIVGFFAATKSKPNKGDETAWCAAFANWILVHCGLPGTQSAAAVSFRGHLQQTDRPERGDLVCFQKRSSPVNGHIGFFESWSTPNAVINLCGGNQGNRLGIKEFRVDDGDMRVIAYRTDPRLRRR